MLRVAVASAVLSVVGGLRLDVSQHHQEPSLTKRFTGPEHRNCGIRDKASARRQREEVIGGTVIDDPSEFPFLVWVGDNDGTWTGQFCGGSLISDRVVLTAGHCLYSTDSKNAKMWVRLRLANYAEMPGIARNVVNWRRHQNFSMATLHNDLTLLLLNESVPADLVAPLQLSDGSAKFEHSGDKVVVGWGSTDEQCMVYDTILRKADVPFGTDGPECSTKGSKTLTAADDFDVQSQCCAGDYYNNMRYPGCGDSGGPLLANNNGTWFQVGMVSWSFGIPFPDVFTRVSYFRDWINETMYELTDAGVHPAVAPEGKAKQNLTQG